MGATGEAREKGLYDTARDYAFADLKGDLDALGQLASPSSAGGIQWEQGGPNCLNPVRVGTISVFTNLKFQIGFAGQLARRVREHFKFRQEVFLAELDLDPFYISMHVAKDARRYEPLPRFPAVERDFSLFLLDGTRFSDVTRTIRSLNIAEVASIEAVDLFRGKNVTAGKYSLLVRVTFQSRETTLTEAQINDFSARIIGTLEKTLGAQLRAS
jgi:phenylalanyl-tRNA synthetase beta subunit